MFSTGSAKCLLFAFLICKFRARLKPVDPGAGKWFQFAWESLAEPMPDEEVEATDNAAQLMAEQGVEWRAQQKGPVPTYAVAEWLVAGGVPIRLPNFEECLAAHHEAKAPVGGGMRG